MRKACILVLAVAVAACAPTLAQAQQLIASLRGAPERGG
jgi:hypothetical protein